MLSFKQFLTEAKRERVQPKPVTLYHGSTDYWFPNKQVRTNKGEFGEFHMTTNPRTAAGYSVGEFAISADQRLPNDPTVLRFTADQNRFMVATNPNLPSEYLKIGDQASRRAVGAKNAMQKALRAKSIISDKWEMSNYSLGTDPMVAINRQIQRLLSAGKGTQGQREFEGTIRPRPKSDEVEWIIPKHGKLDITRTGTTEQPVEDPDEKLDFTQQNIPQTSLAVPKTKRPNIGVSAFQGIQLTGPRLTQVAKDIEDRGSYFDLAPLDGDGDHIHASLDPNDPLYIPR